VAGAPLNWEAEIAFHRALVELAQCPAFLAEYDHIMRLGMFVLVGTFSVESPFPPDPSGRWHAALVEDLQTADPGEAERILRTHLEFGRQQFLRPPARPGGGSSGTARA
jgi:DNA-binding FadR family transcriptional regulator